VTQGRFISLEGGEGTGKSTQAFALATALETNGYVVRSTREPGGTPGAEIIRELLLTGGEEKWNMRTEALLFAAARAEHCAKLIRPALARGEWVICDRFIDSSRAYQSVNGELGDAEIMELHKVGSNGLMPDRTFILDRLRQGGRWREIAGAATELAVGIATIIKQLWPISECLLPQNRNASVSSMPHSPWKSSLICCCKILAT
jgi:dTMP kinase